MPAIATASLFLPTDQPAKVTESGRSIEDVKELRFERVEDGRVVVVAGSGTYDFVVKRK